MDRRAHEQGMTQLTEQSFRCEPPIDRRRESAEASKPFVAEPSMDRRAHEQARPAERHGWRESDTLQDVEVERRVSAK